MKDACRKAMFCRFAKLQTVKAPAFHSANHLPIQISVVVPSTKAKSKPIGDDEFKNRVISEKTWFDKRFGGDTAVKDVGSYLMDGKQLIEEPGMVVESSTTTKKYNKFKNRFAKHIEKRRRDWGQDTMAARIEGQMFIVPKKGYIDNEKCRDKKIIVT